MSTRICQKDSEERVNELEREIQVLRARVEELQDSASFFKEVVDNSRDIIYRRGAKDGVFEYFNAATTGITGYTPEQMQNIGGENFVLKLVHPDDQESCRTELEAAYRSEDKVVDLTVQYRFERKDGRYVWLDEKMTVVKDSSGNPDFVVGNVRDISAEKRAVEALQESESRFAAFMEHIPACMFIKDNDSTPLYGNKYLLETMMGTSVEDKKETNRYGIPEDLVPRFHVQDNHVLKGGVQEIVETLPDRTGQERLFRTLKFPIHREGRAALIGGFSIDITEQAKAEQGLQESEKKYRTLFQASGETIILTGPMSKIIDINQAGLDLLGYTRDELIGRNYQELVVDASIRESFVQEMISKGYVKDFEDKLQTKDGAIIDCLLSVNPIIADDGTLYGYQGIVHDITDRKRIEKELREREAQYRNIFTSIKDGLIIFDRAGRIVEVNRQTCDLYGYSRSEFLGMKGKSLVSSEYYHVFDRFRREVKARGEFKEESVDMRKDGTTLPVEIRGTEFEYGGQKHLLAIVRDISDRKRVEEALQQSERKYRELVENANSIIMRMDSEGNVTFFNEFAQQFFGYREDEIIGKNVIGTIVPEAESDGRDLVTLIKDIARHPSRYYNNENENMRKNGERVWISWTNKPVYNEQGRVIETFCVGNDITARKEAEQALRVSEEKFRTMFERSPVGIELFDSDGVLIDANPACMEIFGVKDTSASKQFNLLNYAGIPDEIRAKTARGEASRYVAECNFDTVKELGFPDVENGKTTFLDILTTPLVTKEESIHVSYLVHMQDITARKQAEAQIHSLTRQLLDAQEQERKRIAMDLHDNLAQELSALAIRCYTEFDEFCSQLPELRKRVDGFSGRLKETVESVRHLAYDLRPSTLELFGIGQAVEEYCGEFSSKHGISIDCSSAGIDDLDLDANTSINIYRIVQEALNNVRNHAHAGQVKVRMIASYPHVILRIEDDGKGFDMASRSKEAVRERRMGLINIEERVKLLQGTFQLQASPSKGTQLYLEVPYQKEKPSV